MRLVHVSPMKNVEFHYRTSFLSETLREAHVSPDVHGDMLRRIGTVRKAMTDFMKSFMKDERYIAVDLIHVVSMSEGVISATPEHNSMEEYLTQVQILFLFSLENDAPAYFRILPGSIYSVMSLKATMEETGSMKNVLDLEIMKIFFIIPLKRNSKLIDYSIEVEKHFMFQDRSVFYSKYHDSGRTVYTFRNDFLRAEEEKAYLQRHRDGSASAFRKARESVETISL